MKARFLTNMILSASQLVIGIFLIIFLDNENSVIAFATILTLLTIASFVMGIVTLAMPKGETRGLGIASGVTTLIPYSSMIGAAAIVSLIGYLKQK